MTQERPGSTARGPQHVMMKLQIYNTSPHFGKGIVSIMMLVRQGSSLRAACAQMGLSYSKAWRLLKSAEADLGIPLLDTQKGGTKRAGSTLTMDRALRNLLSFTGRPMEDVLPMLSQTPAALLGDSHLGAIAPGYDADFVLLDDAGNILQTYIQGKPHNI